MESEAGKQKILRTLSASYSEGVDYAQWELIDLLLIFRWKMFNVLKQEKAWFFLESFDI
jgi:hypothetical protein